jgi:hypothetical protein
MEGKKSATRDVKELKSPHLLDTTKKTLISNPGGGDCVL